MGTSKKQKKREWLRYRDFVLSPYGVIKIKSLGYITNLETNNVFDMLEYRTQEHLKPFFKDLPNGNKVEWVCTDMWRPFKRSFAQYLPNAKPGCVPQFIFTDWK